jgi:methylated-DNA-protein-cysteine methyltransferase-like protein
LAQGFYERVYAVVSHIPKGKVATYGQIAAFAGNPRCARQVGWALHVNPEPGIVPCHRVVFSSGALTEGFAFGGMDAQAELLEGEGVEVLDGRFVDLGRFRWNPDDADAAVLHDVLSHLQ